jgi:antitoxin (DNA-binding transcriptional repressor) of toxin-antitoxin stability system
MQTVIIDDATARLSDLCEKIAQTGELLQITRQGRPVALIARWPDSGVWAARENYERQHGQISEDFEIPGPEIGSSENPLD